jgi:hypothetical protein
MALMPSKVHIVKFFINFALLHSKTTPNTTLFIGVVILCANWNDGFGHLCSHPLKSHYRIWAHKWVHGSWIQRTQHPINPTLNLSKNNFGPNLATLTFAMNPLVP